MVIYQIPIDGLLLCMDKHIQTLPFPLPHVIEPKTVLKQSLAISIGYENRRDLINTQLGQALYLAGGIPYQIEKFIDGVIKDLEAVLLNTCSLKLHYSEHTYELSTLLVVRETDTLKPTYTYVSPMEQTDYHRRVLQEQLLEQEREEAYEFENARHLYRNYQPR